MNILYYLGKISLSGGSLVLARHVRLLCAMGHHAELVCSSRGDDYDYGIPVRIIGSPEKLTSLHADIVVVSHAGDLSAVRPFAKHLVFLVQGPHLEELKLYYLEKKALPKYTLSLGHALLHLREYRDLHRLRKAYAAADTYWCVSPQLQEYMASLGYSARLLRNTVSSCFHPPKQRQLPITILLAGTHAVQFKNIPAGLEALKRLKERLSVHIVHVSTGETLTGELAQIPDEKYTRLSQIQMADLCRRCHILFSPSLTEGFGLPALEGMASGMVCVLSDIVSYHSFGVTKQSTYTTAPYALYFDPSDIASMTDKLEEAVQLCLTHNELPLIHTALHTCAYYSEEGLQNDLKEALHAIPEPGKWKNQE